MHALVGAVKLGRDLEEALEYAEDYGWSAADPLFTDTVVYANGHMATSDYAIKLAGRLGTYLLAGDLMPETTSISCSRTCGKRRPTPVSNSSLIATQKLRRRRQMGTDVADVDPLGRPARVVLQMNPGRRLPTLVDLDVLLHVCLTRRINAVGTVNVRMATRSESSLVDLDSVAAYSASNGIPPSGVLSRYIDRSPLKRPSAFARQ